ncbi:MAG: hypothetical protein Q9211_004890 [Gyalolechia sp. 1 TL-2023]
MAAFQDVAVRSTTVLVYSIALSPLLFVIWAIVVSIRNAYFHPLSKFPGPKSAAATPIPYVRKLVKGDLVPWVMALHAKYGEVVRVTPDELSFISPSAWQDIYTTRPQLPKPEKGVFKASNGVPTIASTTVTEDHTRQRRVLSHAFSERALRAQEDILQRYTDLLVAKLHEVISRAEIASVTLDMSKWYNYTTFDTIGDLCYNDPFHSLENSADHPWVDAVFAGLKSRVISTAFHHFPPMPALVKYVMPHSISEKAKRHFMFSREKIARRIETKTNRPDFMTYILGNNEGEAKMGRDEIDATGAFLILAGSETSATTCSASTYFFLKNPSVYKRLQAEIRNAFPSMSEITTPAVNKLPYLHAVITEALRMHPAAAVSVPRIVDRPGVVVSGHEIPVGVRPRWYRLAGPLNNKADDTRRAVGFRRKPCSGHQATLWNRILIAPNAGSPKPTPNTTPIAKRRMSLSWLGRVIA